VISFYKREWSNGQTQQYYAVVGDKFIWTLHRYDGNITAWGNSWVNLSAMMTWKEYKTRLIDEIHYRQIVIEEVSDLEVLVLLGKVPTEEEVLNQQVISKN